jgi:hypothetical protein
VDLDLRFGAYCKSAAKLACDTNAWRQPAAACVNKNQDKQYRVVGKSHPTPARTAPRKRKRNKAKRD